MTPHLRHLPGKRLLPILSLLCLSAGISPAIAAPEFLGADGVIALVKKATGAPEEQSANPGKEEARRLTRDLEGFKTARAKLAPEEAVDRWLKLYDRFRMLPADAVKSPQMNPFARAAGEELSLRSLVSALPPPAAWDLLKARVLARPVTDGGTQETVLRALVFFLTQDTPNLEKTLAQLKAGEALKGNSFSSFLFRDLRVDGARQKAGKGADTIVGRFDTYLQALKGERPEGRITIQVPDLVALAGDTRAEELILTALAIPGLSLDVPAGGATLDLAKRLALKNVATLTDPQWRLVTTTRDTELYEALDKRFPGKEKKEDDPDLFREGRERFRLNGDDSERRKARTLYILGLIAGKRVQEATAQAKQMEPEEFRSKEFEKQWHSFDKLRHGAGLNQFCRELLTERPELPLWKQCGTIASGAKESDGLVTIVEAAAKRPGLGFEARLGIRERQVELLLALDRSDDAVALLREMITAEAGSEPPQVRRSAGQARLRLAARLCVLGRLLGRPELVKESEETFLAALGNGAGISLADMAVWNVKDADSPVGTMVETYLEKGDFAGAERLVVTVMEATLKAPDFAEMPAGRELVLSGGLLAGHLARLAEIYARAGRNEDVLALLDKAAWWGGTDLIDLADANEELPAVAARALHLAGRDAEAVEILKAHLLGKPGDDAAHAVLTGILGPAVIPWLDTLQARDRFEERPLIWKAQLLLTAGKLDEAETTVRQALKIDPTDGEQKPGNRGRAYVVLADVLRARGKADDAAFFDRVVAAVHIAETGDKLTEAGLIRKSLATYEEAARSFADAYCVQWRLAERLSSMGDMEGARKHYEIAFERMPEQFGQVASFCFGCQGVFTHQQSVSVAEEVLTGLAKTAPRKPQVHYLLGQLREAQGRKAEAYRHFRTAADLDPQYLDALKAAYALRKDVFLGQAEADELALRMVSLDPLNRHDHLNAGEISDLKGLWGIYEEKGRETVTIPKTLLPLTASKKELETLLAKFGAATELLDLKHNTFRDQRAVPEPGDAVVKNDFVKKLLQATGQGGMMFD